MSWWSDQDDLVLLTQVNNDRPFLSKTGVMKAWDEVASKLAQVPDFSRTDLDGKKLENRLQDNESNPRDITTPQKRNYISDIHEKEIKLDEEKLAFKKLKLEKDSIEREKEREERAKDREERRLDRELEQKRSSDMMHIMQILLEKINR
ncbi:hypothetical protein AC1031_000122 [Aphanomyces cochlioides]|nr:hypothetical protein AC1031_000122 [Aphanomyces cochlioides]